MVPVDTMEVIWLPLMTVSLVDTVKQLHSDLCGKTLRFQ